MAEILAKTTKSKKKGAEKLSDSEHESEEEIKKKLKEPPVAPKIEDWTNARTYNRGFDINESANLDDDEKTSVKKLMKSYMGGAEPDELSILHYELVYLLNKAFVASFDIQILRDFTKALRVNDDITTLPSFTLFAAWWKTRNIKPRSRSRSGSANSRNGSGSGWDGHWSNT